MELERLKGSGRVVEYGEFLRFSEKAGGMPRGTLIAGDRTVTGYPKIPRIFVVGEGIGENIQSAEMLVEEKIDGYNVRALMHRGRLMCLSRGGFMDYFAVEKLSDDAAVKAFFGKHPGWMLCGEMIGNTPHTAPTDEYDVKYYVFDIVDEHGEFLPPMERRDLCREYGLTPVPLVGVFRKDEIAKLKGAVRKMDKEGKEGIVVRGLEGGEVFKLVTPSSDIHDLAESSAQLFDMPAGFMKQRVFRSAVSVRDLGMDKAEFAKRLGAALYSELEGALDAREAVQRFRVWVKSRSTWDSILAGMGHEVELRIEKEERKGKGYGITFVKVMKESTRMARRAVEGRMQED